MSRTSLNFIWNEYQHCNNDSILVEYEYELRIHDYHDYYMFAPIYSGRKRSASIAFDNLESDTMYSFCVSTSVICPSTGTRKFSIGIPACVYDITTTEPGMFLIFVSALNCFKIRCHLSLLPNYKCLRE